MAFKLPPEWLDELRSRVSIDEVVGESVPLKRKGKYLWACCPFHNEKTPSFKVDTDSQMFYCFGCHKGGDSSLWKTTIWSSWRLSNFWRSARI